MKTEQKVKLIIFSTGRKYTTNYCLSKFSPNEMEKFEKNTHGKLQINFQGLHCPIDVETHTSSQMLAFLLKRRIHFLLVFQSLS